MWALDVILYMLIYACTPFHCSSIPALYPGIEKQIISGQYDFPVGKGREIATEAKDLIRQLLNINPNERLSVEGVLKHAWITSDGMTRSIARQAMCHQRTVKICLTP